MNYIIGNYEFKIEYDFKENSDIMVHVYYKEKNIAGRNFTINDTIKHIRNFCNKFAKDENYRNKYLENKNTITCFSCGNVFKETDIINYDNIKNCPFCGCSKEDNLSLISVDSKILIVCNELMNCKM